MSDAWERYAADFSAMDDDEIEDEYRRSIREMEEHEAWIEAVVSWREAGCPRGNGAA